jgi:hypothetical protein
VIVEVAVVVVVGETKIVWVNFNILYVVVVYNSYMWSSLFYSSSLSFSFRLTTTTNYHYSTRESRLAEQLPSCYCHQLYYWWTNCRKVIDIVRVAEEARVVVVEMSSVVVAVIAAVMVVVVVVVE